MLILVILLGMLTLSCREEETPTPTTIELNFDFAQNMEEWMGGFSDLPAEGQDIYELDISHAPLPEETNEEGNAIRIQGHNRSDDLFMFLKKHIHGLEPNTRYRVVYELELASQYPESSFGIGGSPGGSVFLKVGGSTQEPVIVLDEDTQHLQMSIDKGDQSQEGADMINIGTVGIEGEEFRYRLIQRNNADRPFEVATDTDGGCWVIVGTDSGFEGLTVLYYNAIHLTFRKIAQ